MTPVPVMSRSTRTPAELNPSRNERAALRRPTNRSHEATSPVERSVLAIARDWQDCPPFELVFPGRRSHRIGDGDPAFRITANTEHGVMALKSLDEPRIGQAYLSGDVELDGDMLTLLDLRTQLTDRHLLRLLWSVWIQPMFLGRMRSDRKSIGAHYDLESDFFLKFIEKKTHCYSHGYFERDDETLEQAVQRKLETAMESCGIQPGWRVLDVGAGWGTFLEYAGKRGVDVTAITMSTESERYLAELVDRRNLPCRVSLEHFMDHRPKERYDAIVNFGTTEHLPDYRATLRQYERVLKPGGRVFLDAVGAYRRNTVSSWTRKHIWTGSSQFLQLSRYVRAVERSGMELIWVRSNRRSYMLTMKHWAQNLERNKDEICARWGEELYRRYRIYLWGGAHTLKTGRITAYRMLLELPEEEKSIRPRIFSRTAVTT